MAQPLRKCLPNRDRRLLQRRLENLTGKQLVAYRTQRLLVDLTSEERSAYNAANEVYMGYVGGRGVQHSHGASWLQELQRLSTVDPTARRAWLARAQILKLLESCRGKFAALEALLRQYDGERMLVFTESAEVAYTISREYLVPAITRVTAGTERRYILDAFRAGRYRVVVTTELLKEGVDVPEAKVAVVLGGGTRTRKYLQQIEGSLCKKDLLQVALIEVLVRDTLEMREIAERENGIESKYCL